MRAANTVLVDTFGKADGLASEDIVILDPAVGTATFLRKIIDIIHDAKCSAGLGGAWSSYVHDKLLPRLFGFELLMAPYTVAHLKLELQLREQGFTFDRNERLHVYLTNSLDRVEGRSGSLMEQWLSKESEGAEDVKENQPVQVIIGNPPYRGESTNKSDWILQLLDIYKKEPTGERLQERTGKWINNDYVKFIRFAHWRIEKTGKGIVEF